MQTAIFQFSLFGINTYLVFDTDTNRCSVIDPGMSNEEEQKAISRFIDEKGLTLTNIINTHLHIDHAIGIPYLKNRYKVPVLSHQGDEILGERMTQQAAMFGLPITPEGITISHYLNDGDVIKIGRGTLDVIEVPGHSKGSIALYDPDAKALYSGDALFQGSIGRTDLPGGNYTELITNIKNKLLSLPDDTTVYPGHGPATTIGIEKRKNPFLT